MGANLSNQYTQNTVDSLTSVVNQTVSNVLQTASTNCTSSNTYNALFGSYPTSVNLQTGEITFARCDTNINSVDINQIATGSCNLSSGITSDVQANITNNLASNINTWMTQNAAQNNGWIGIGLNIASQEQINQVQLSTMIANTISSNISQTCSAFVAASNLFQVSYCGNYPNGVVNTQQAISQNLTSCIVNNVVTLIVQNEVLNNIVTKTSQQTNQTNQGISDIFRWLVIGGIVIAALIIIGVLLFFIFGGSKSGPPQPTELQKKEHEKMVLERELREKKERAEGIRGEGKEGELGERIREGSPGAREAFEREEEAASPSAYDRFTSLARRYGSRFMNYAEEAPIE